MIVAAAPSLPAIEAAARLPAGPGRFLLHSGSDADGLGGASFCGAFPARVLRAGVDDLADPFGAATALGGFSVGYFGYDLGRRVERLPRRDLVGDALWLARYDAVWRRDETTGACAVVGTDATACARLAAALAEPRPPARAPILGALEPEAPAERHLRAVRRILAYIRAGDVYQVNLARRLRAEVRAPGDAVALYARLAPAPFGAVLETDGLTLVSNSPELYLRVAGRRVETRPIKGTRAAGADPAGLAADEKERAEHLMIVDLLRNDLGRVAEIGSVVVEDFCRVVTLPTVHHLVSTVAARLRPDATLADVLRAAFPGGSITGAPKVRAMEIIDELEPAARGPYTGALGYVGWDGDMELAIVIRTAELRADALTLSVGGGIVADSDPARELEETEEKAAAWRRALG
ncbi:MAG TPA: chorismate-binding protein [Haliangiales bacterium]|nr:chorismate-binding protein [Haliangiales bacterium]